VIADRAGFSYVESLSVAFRQAVGMPPGQFRRRHAAAADRRG